MGRAYEKMSDGDPADRSALYGGHIGTGAQKLNIYMDKEALLSHDVSSADIRIRPEGMVRVTRHSLWP